MTINWEIILPKMEVRNPGVVFLQCYEYGKPCYDNVPDCIYPPDEHHYYHYQILLNQRWVQVFCNAFIASRLESVIAIPWRLGHNGPYGVSNYQPHDCLLNRLLSHVSKKTPKLRAIGFCAGNSPVTGEFPAQMVSNAENVSTWWRHHVISKGRDDVSYCKWSLLAWYPQNESCGMLN